jgi:cysteine desulfurase
MHKVRKNEAEKLFGMSKQLYNGLNTICPDLKLNGHQYIRHPGNINITLPHFEAKNLITLLQPKIAFSTGSACTSNNIEPSHVLKAIGLTTEEADRSFRLSVGRFTTSNEIDDAISLFTEVFSSYANS